MRKWTKRLAIYITFAFVVILAAFSFTACKNTDDVVEPDEKFSITGTVSDEAGTLSGVKVVLNSKQDTAVTTDSTGKYSFSELDAGEYTLSFQLDGYNTESVTVNTSTATDGSVTKNVTLTVIVIPVEAVTVVGTVTDEDGMPVENVSITSKGFLRTVTTGADGKYSVTDAEKIDQTLTFKKNGYNTVQKTIQASEIENNTITVDVILKLKDLFSDKTNTELKAEYATMNVVSELTASSGQGTANHISNVWHTGGGGTSETITEGYRITSTSTYSDDTFGKYVYGKVSITDKNDTFTFYARTFRDVETEFALKVIDPTSLSWKYITVEGQLGEWMAFTAESYTRFDFDLSAYEGKDAIIVLGVRKAALTIETTAFTDNGEYVFGRTTSADIAELNNITVSENTTYTATVAPIIQNDFVTIGTGKTDNNRWLLRDANGSDDDSAEPFSYVYLKTTINKANARLSVRWSNYNNQHGEGNVGKTKVLAYEPATGNIKVYSNGSGNYTGNEWMTSAFELDEIIGKEVVLAIGMSKGNNMGIDYITFSRLSYDITGTVTLPDSAYSMDKVGFYLNESELNIGTDIAFDENSGVYTLSLSPETVGTFKVIYDNNDITIETDKILAYSISLSTLTVSDSVTLDITLEKDTAAPTPIYITITAGGNALTTKQTAEIVVKLGAYSFTYDDGKYALLTANKADALSAETITITLSGETAFVYESNELKLSSGNYSGSSAELSVNLIEKELLPGKTYATISGEYVSMSEVLLTASAGQGTANHISNVWHTGGNGSSDTISEGYRITSDSAYSDDTFGKYIYGKVSITATANSFAFYGRTFGSQTQFALMVIDLNSMTLQYISPIGGTKWTSFTSENYTRFDFDLSDYIGKNVIVALGVRTAALTIETTAFTDNGEYVFGRTTSADIAELNNITVSENTTYTATVAPITQNTFVTTGAASIDNARWLLRDANGSDDDSAEPFSYVYLKTTINKANALLTVKWRSYGNKHDGRYAKTKVLAIDPSTGTQIELYVHGEADGSDRVGDNELTSVFKLNELIGSEVILAIGMSKGNRMGLEYISFKRLNYDITGAVTLPDSTYDLEKVSFELNGEVLANGDNFSYDSATGNYLLTLGTEVTGTLLLKYDNTGLTDEQSIIDYQLQLSSLSIADSVTKNIELIKNVASPIEVNVTVTVDDSLLTDGEYADISVTLGSYSLVYVSIGLFTIDSLTMSEALAEGSILVELTGGLAYIYSERTVILNSSHYTSDCAELTINITQKDILPGLTYDELLEANDISYAVYNGGNGGINSKNWHAILSNFNKSETGNFQEQNEGDTIQLDTGLSTSDTVFNGFIYGKKTITAANSSVFMQVRRHNAAVNFGLMVVNLETGELTLVGKQNDDSASTYTEYTFDLSAFIGQTVVIAIGTFYQDGDSYAQFVMKAIYFFADGDNLSTWYSSSDADWENIVDAMAEETLESDNIKSASFYSGKAADINSDNFILRQWGSVKKSSAGDIEIVNEGALIKTREGKTDLSNNRSFVYAKFGITSENCYLTLKVRCWKTSITSTGLTVYGSDNGELAKKTIAGDTSNFVLPTGGSAVNDTDNWVNWHDGDQDYVTLKWDLSEFVGQDIVIMIGVRNIANTELEPKMYMEEINMTAAPITP